MDDAAPTRSGAGAGPQQLRRTLRRPGHLAGPALAALLGIPVSLVAFRFVVLLHEAEHALPSEVGAAR